jgi:hypothetical protein
MDAQTIRIVHTHVQYKNDCGLAEMDEQADDCANAIDEIAQSAQS